MRLKLFLLILSMISLVFLLGGCLESGEQPILISLSITSTEENLEVSQTSTLTAIGKDQNGNKISVTPTWSVSNEIGKVSPTKGSTTLFTATKTGEGKITATVGSTTASINFTVTQTLTAIEIQPTTVTLFEKERQTLTAIGQDRFGNQMEITPDWSIMGGCGTVAPTSGSTVTFTASTPGSGTIMAKVGEINGECAVTVKKEPVLTTLEITPATFTLKQAETMNFSALGRDQYGNTVPVTPTWSISNSLGTLSVTEGDTTTFTATTPGKGKLTATAGSISGFADITVLAPSVLTTLKITPTQVQMVINTQQTFTTSAEDQYGDPMPVQPIWKVTNQIGSIQYSENETVVFKAAKAGSGVVIASIEGSTISASAAVTVFPIVQSITITPETCTLHAGNSQIFSATVLDENGDQIPLKPIWTVTNQIGSLVHNDDRTVNFTAEKAGSGAIVASAGDVSGSADITVIPAQ